MNLGQFHARVAAAIKRGNSMDALIPTWVSTAARLLEQNYTFSWMRRATNITFPQGSIALVSALDPLLKSVDWIKPILDVGSDGTEWYGDPIVGTDDRLVLGINGGLPSGFWIDGEDGGYELRLDAIPQAEYKIKMKWNKFTDWPVDDNATPALLLRGEYALLVQTLIVFANEMRDPRMAETYGGILQGALQVLLGSEEDLKLAHQNDLKMNYSGLQ